jgi:hypothetical protein
MAKTRPRWVSWLPAIFLAVVIVAALVVGFIMVRGGLGAPAPKPTEGQVTDLNWSSFTPDGMAYLERSREIRIDLSAKGADAEGLGLPADGTTTIGPNSEGLNYTFIFKGGDVGLGGDKLVISTLDITTAAGEISVVHANIADIMNFRNTLNRLVGESELYGWDPSIRDGIFDMVADATAAGQPYEFTFGPADSVGTPVSATAQCDTSGFCLLSYDIGPGVRAG